MIVSRNDNALYLYFGLTVEKHFYEFFCIDGLLIIRCAYDNGGFHGNESVTILFSGM